MDQFMVDLLMRWAHVISGIAWIGLLYFFNFVNVPFQGKMEGPTKKLVNPELLPRALWWFRWAAMSTLVWGLLLFYWVYMNHGDYLGQMRDLTPAHKMTGRALYIMIGMTLAIGCLSTTLASRFPPVPLSALLAPTVPVNRRCSA